MTTSEFDCEVLVIGAGPVGATMTGLLADEGISVVACEAGNEIYPLPRAAHVDHEIMRLFQSMGLSDHITPHTRPVAAYEFLTADRQLLMRFDLPVENSPSGWPTSNMIYQPLIEGALRTKIDAAPHAELKVNWRYLRHTQTAHGVIAHFETPGGEASLSARYLIGCDGSSSTVREAVGSKLLDYQFDEPWLVIDTLVHDASRLPEINLQICDPARPTTCVLMAAGRHRWEFMLKPGETPEMVLEDSFIDRLLEPWDVAGAVEIERKAVYRFHALVADHWRQDRVFLAGDAAHQMPPFAGQGLCSGMRDAANLCWKIAAVLRDEADDDLLDSYQQEREPHVRAIIDLALMMGRTVCILDPGAAAARDAEMLAMQTEGSAVPPAEQPPLESGCLLAESASAGVLFPQPWEGDEKLDDVLGRGAWLITRETLSQSPLRAFAEQLGAWLEERSADAVLVRPDRYIFGTGEADTLRRAYPAALAH